jgi:hypothetical protein
MVQICDQLSFLLSGTEQLNIEVMTSISESTLQVDMDNAQLTGTVPPVYCYPGPLRISCRLQPLVASALQGRSGELTTEVLPALDNLFLEEHQASGAARHRAIQNRTSAF